jgi:putative flippase GtrA
MSHSPCLRVFKFSLVGGIGVGVQLGVLATLTAMRINYLLATALAVEVAVIHNFLWHQRFTWPERARTGMRDSIAALFRFHVSNGLISLVGNLLLMRLLVPGFRLPVLRANIATIAACFVANFLASDRWVFLASSAGHANRVAKRNKKSFDGVTPRVSAPRWSAPASAPACVARMEHKSAPP